MTRLIITFILLVGMFAGSRLSGQSEDGWVLSKTKDGVEIFTKKSQNSAFKSFKAQMTAPGTVESFVAVLQDIDALPEWGYSIKGARLLARTGDTIQVYWAEASVPFPFSNRDGIYLNKFRWNRKASQLKVDIDLLPEYLEPYDKLVRVKGNGEWQVKVLGDGNLELTFSMEVDPGGSIPAWLVNTFIEDTPYVTMISIREMMKKARYQGKKFDFIK
ncbi:MAG: hypothetical protein IH598_10550 [Bacteroidales bacterium]|nr:hypothetical protein [Bacteroidales bacterium]